MYMFSAIWYNNEVFVKPVHKDALIITSPHTRMHISAHVNAICTWYSISFSHVEVNMKWLMVSQWLWPLSCLNDFSSCHISVQFHISFPTNGVGGVHWTECWFFRPFVHTLDVYVSARFQLKHKSFRPQTLWIHSLWYFLGMIYFGHALRIPGGPTISAHFWRNRSLDWL